MSCNNDEKNIAKLSEDDEETDPVHDNTDASLLEEIVEVLDYNNSLRRNHHPADVFDGDDIYETSSSSSSSSIDHASTNRPSNDQGPSSSLNSPTSVNVAEATSSTNINGADLNTEAAHSDPGPTMESFDKADVDISRSVIPSSNRGRVRTRSNNEVDSHHPHNNAWRDKIRSMVIQARDGGLVILQRVLERQDSINSTSSKAFEDYEDGVKNGMTRSTTDLGRSTHGNSRQQQLEHVPTNSTLALGILLGRDRSSQMNAPPPDNDSISVSSARSFGSLSIGSWSVSWPRPGAYFVRYMRRHPAEATTLSLSRRQRRDATMATNARPFAHVVQAVTFPYAIPILDDEEASVVRVQGIAYDQNAAARQSKQRRRRLCIVMLALLSAMLLMFAAVGVAVVVLAKKSSLFVPHPPPSATVPVSPRPQKSTPSPTPYHEAVTLKPYLVRFAQAVGNNLVFQNGTAQRLAANWMFYSDPMQLPVHNEHLIQRYIMVLFYFQMSDNGKSAWRFCNPPSEGVVDSCLTLADYYIPFVANDDEVGLQYFRWLSGKHECHWMGASCDMDNVLWALQLNGMNLTGTLPTELTVLSSLQAVSLSFNYIKGTVPDAFPQLKNLVQFNLQSNSLTGTLSELWYQTSDLRSLNIGSNKIRGNVSTKLGLLGNLTELQLFDNKLTGTIPTEIGALSHLSTFQISQNSFHGTIPTELGRLSLLKQLWLNDNKLVGTIPSEVGLLTPMTDLRLSRNVISGTIPAEFYNLTNLQLRLDLQSMNLNGTLSTRIGLMTNLELLLIGRNRLHGTIPTQLANLKYLGLASFGLNLFTGPIPNQLCHRSIELQADCAPQGFPFQECSCCQSCCNRLTGSCSFNNIFNL